MNDAITPGAGGTHSAVVGDTDTAIALGSGSVPVLATPRLVAWLEAAAVAALTGSLPDGSTTVGTHIDVRHLAATAVGKTVRVVARVRSVEGRTIEFDLEADDDRTRIAEGVHTRVVVDEARFLARL